MKKLLSIAICGLALWALFVGFGVPVAEAQQAGAGLFDRFTVPEACDRIECGWKEFVMLGNEILKFAIFLAVIFATLAFAIAGWKMMTNAGNEGEIKKAKDMMLKALLGILVTMIAWLLVDFILDQLNVSSEFRLFIYDYGIGKFTV